MLVDDGVRLWVDDGELEKAAAAFVHLRTNVDTYFPNAESLSEDEQDRLIELIRSDPVWRAENTSRSLAWIPCPDASSSTCRRERLPGSAGGLPEAARCSLRQHESGRLATAARRGARRLRSLLVVVHGRDPRGHSPGSRPQGRGASRASRRVAAPRFGLEEAEGEAVKAEGS
jgi:hypothetical protein